MKTRLKIILSTLIICAISFSHWGCSDQHEYQESEILSKSATEGRAGVVYADAVYHEETDSWIRSQKDPYTLENFQKAYDNLALGKSSQSLTKTVAGEFCATKKLNATHYNVKIYPKTEEEQRKLELAGDVAISYYPFDYVQLPEEEAESMAKTAVRTLFPKEGRYTVVHEDYVSEEGPMEPETLTLPVLYAVWPCDKAFPADMDYEILYEVYLPERIPVDAATQMAKSMDSGLEAAQVLEAEAIRLALGEIPLTRGPNPTHDIPSGSVYATENFLNKYVPMHNLKIRVQLGSLVYDTYTNASGYYQINYLTPLTATLSFIWQHEKWYITSSEQSTSAKVSMRGTLADYNRKTIYMGAHPSSPHYEIHRAVNHYYYGTHNISRYKYSEGIRIVASNYAHPDYRGLFVSSGSGRAYIIIYYRSAHYKSCGATFHELGHFTHLGMKGFENYKNLTHKLLKESWASYACWNMVDSYYIGQGYVKDFGEDITGDERQKWNKTDIIEKRGRYSPLFVDLADDYNQYVHISTLCPNDQIKNVPHSIIRSIAAESTTWASCKNILRRYIGVYYTSAELNNYISAYDYWFAYSDH